MNSPSPSSRLRLVASFVLAAAIFALDLGLPRVIAVWLVYMIPVLMTLGATPRRMFEVMVGLCSVLTVIAPLVEPGAHASLVEFANRAIGLLVFWIFALLLRRRRDASDRLRETAAALASAQRVAQVGNWTWHLDDDRVQWSDEMFHILGLDPARPPADLNQAMAALVHPDDRAVFDQIVIQQGRRTLGGDEPLPPLEFRVIRTDGTERHLRAELGERIRDQSGHVVSATGIVQDVTDRKRNESRILRLSRLYQATTRCSEAIVRCQTPQELWNEVCRAAVEAGGLKLAWIGLAEGSDVRQVAHYGAGIEYLNKAHIVTSADDPRGRGPTGTSIREGRPVWCQDFLANELTRPWRESGGKFGWRASASLPLRRDNQVVGSFTLYAAEVNAFDEEIQNLLIDMAANIGFGMERFAQEERRVAAETELRASEARNRLLLRNLNAGVIVRDARAGIIFCNERAAELLGLRRDELLGRPTIDDAWEVIQDDGTALPAAERPMHRAMAMGQPVTDVVMGVRHPDQAKRTWLLVSAEPLPGEARQVLCVFHDITKLKATEARLALQSAALAATANSVVITNAQGEIEWVNPAFTRATGYSFEEAVGRNPRILKSGQHPAEFYAQLWRTISSGRTWTGEIVNSRKDGGLLTEQTVITPVRDETGAIAHFVAVKQDVTDRRSLEKQLFQTQRLESIGLLASGIAHDLNNIIAPISLSIEVLRTRYPGEQKYLDLVEQCARRGADIVRQVLAFSRGMDGTRMPMRLSRLVKEMTHLMHETLPRNIDVSYDIACPKEPDVRVDPTQIHQVLLNLAVNARDAMPKGGQLTFTLALEALDEAAAARTPGATAGEFVVITVTDTGAGIAADILPMIFDPFFTTKPRGQGTGLGLSTVHGIVRSHGGFTRVASTVGVGTTFQVCLPAVAAADPAAAKSSSASPFVAGDGRLVLVVDDEVLIREITRTVLEKLGFKTVLAGSGEEAVETFRAHQADVKIALLDRMMPGMNGEAVAEIIHRLAPDVPIFLSTGLVTEDSLAEKQEELKRAGVRAVLRKPYTETDLIKVFREHL